MEILYNEVFEALPRYAAMYTAMQSLEEKETDFQLAHMIAKASKSFQVFRYSFEGSQNMCQSVPKPVLIAVRKRILELKPEWQGK